jgi:hypothetical protein
MYKFESAPLTISGVLKDGWELYKVSLLYVLPLTFIIAIMHVIPFLFNIVGFYHVFTNGRMVFSLWALILYLVILFVEAFFIALLFYIMHSLATEQKTDFPGALKCAVIRLIPLYIALLIYFIFINIGMFLLLLPAIFAAIILSMFLPLIIIERKSIYNSFDSSVRLVWGHWWQTFFILVIPSLVSYLGRNLSQFSAWGMHGHWLLIVDVIILTLIVPYFYAILLVQYNNLKVIKALPKPISEQPRIHDGKIN